MHEGGDPRERRGRDGSLLNHHVGLRVGLRDVDLDCLDLVSRYAPLSPSALARRAGLHPATMTGILDRLERGGWISRGRDPDATDRRAVSIRARRERGAEIFRLYSGMNSSMDRICAGYSDAELGLLADFLRRTIDAGRVATDELGAATTAEASTPARSSPGDRALTDG